VKRLIFVCWRLAEQKDGKCLQAYLLLALNVSAGDNIDEV
jgi:hypothetical protein